MRTIFLSLVPFALLTGCVLLPSSFSLGLRTANRAKVDGLVATLTWNLQPRHVVTEDYLTFDDSQEGGDLP